MSLEEMFRREMEKEKGFPTLEEGRKYLDDYLDQPKSELKEGDYVVRNNFGGDRYKFPGDKQVARVVKIYDQLQIPNDGDNPFDLIIAVAIGKGQGVAYYGVDSKCYQKEKIKKSMGNIFSLVKKKKDSENDE